MTADTDDTLWAAIAEPSRRRVLDLLVRDGEATASMLAAEVPFTRQAVIKHLAVLEDAGLVIRRRLGREVRFRVDPDRLDDATRVVAQLARDWDRRLAHIKQLAEAAYQQDAQHQVAGTEQ
jgi:DNA-binding transcriptional ArsR family regulator